MDARLSAAVASRRGTMFPGKVVDFADAGFSGGRVSFSAASLYGGKVDFLYAEDWSHPVVDPAITEYGLPSGVTRPPPNAFAAGFSGLALARRR